MTYKDLYKGVFDILVQLDYQLKVAVYCVIKSTKVGGTFVVTDLKQQCSVLHLLLAVVE
jgi:hypothetical protein